MLIPDALRLFEAKLAEFGPSPVHFVPDLALRGFLHELHENAIESSTILHGPRPHRAYPLARAAFEACQLSLLLATAADYDLDGAKAWVHYLRKDAELAREHGADTRLDGRTPDEWLQAATDEIGAMWEELSPGKKATVIAAVAFLDKKPRKPDNWAGVSVGKELGRRLRDRAAQAGVAHSVMEPGLQQVRAYTALCRGTHPRPSLRPIRFTLSSERFIIDMEPRDPDADRKSLDALLAGTLNFGTSAINIRLALGAA